MSAKPQEPWQSLRVGDQIRLVAHPTEWQRPGCRLPAETAELWRHLVARRRPLRVYEVDEWGAPLVRCRVRLADRTREHHFLAITNDGWVRVRSRR